MGSHGGGGRGAGVVWSLTACKHDRTRSTILKRLCTSDFEPQYEPHRLDSLHKGFLSVDAPLRILVLL